MRQAEELRYAILGLQREGNRQLATALKPLGITPAQAEVVSVLRQCAPLTLAGLGELLLCETGTGPSRLVDRLVVAGLVARGTGENDRRSVVLTLTESGRAVATQIESIETAFYASIDAVAENHPMAAALELLRALLAPLPSGATLARRTGTRAGSSG